MMGQKVKKKKNKRHGIEDKHVCLQGIAKTAGPFTLDLME